MTLAEVKRRCQVGVSLTMTFHRFPKLWRSESLRRSVEAGNLTRPIVAIQRNGVYLLTEGQHSFLSWPKASQFRATGPNSFDILANPEEKDAAQHPIVMSYRIEESTADQAAESMRGLARDVEE